LRQFSDLLEVKTFGFRGEAISSLCSLSNLSIITKHFSAEHGFHLQFDKNGILIKKNEYARQHGTTVIVENIFKNLPVRWKEFERNIKKEFSKMIQILYNYCLVSVGVKITCTNIFGNKCANLVVSTNGAKNLLDNFTAVFGRKIQENLIEIELQEPDKQTLDEYNLPNQTFINFTWKCFVSSCRHSLGRSCPDRQFFYVNGRPCDPIKIIKLINHIYHKYNNKQYPFIYLNILLNQSYTDVNVTPDKRTILFTQEQIILATIKSNFQRAWNNKQATFTIKTLEELNFAAQKRSLLNCSENLPPHKKPFIQILNKNIDKNKQICLVEDIKTKINKFQLIKQAVNLNEKQENYKNSVQTIKKTQIDNIKINRQSYESLEQCIVENTSIRNQLLNINMIINLETIKTKMIQLKKNQTSKNKTEKRHKYRSQLDSKSLDIEKELERELKKESFEKVYIYIYEELINIYYCLHRCFISLFLFFTDANYRSI
jgi:DNA mismatch repair protein MutL